LEKRNFFVIRKGAGKAKICSHLLQDAAEHDILLKLFPGVAQLVARLTGGQEAVGSSPATRTKTKTRMSAEKFSIHAGFSYF
jgi:hypothetical protein